MDNCHSLSVVLEKDVSPEHIETIVNAIRMIRGVLSVSEHVADIESFMAEERARHKLGQKILDVIYPK